MVWKSIDWIKSLIDNYLTNLADFRRFLLLLFAGGRRRLDNVRRLHDMANHIADTVHWIIDDGIVDHIVDGLTNVVDHIVAVVEAVAVLKDQIGVVAIGNACDENIIRLDEYAHNMVLFSDIIHLNWWTKKNQQRFPSWSFRSTWGSAGLKLAERRTTGAMNSRRCWPDWQESATIDWHSEEFAGW